MQHGVLERVWLEDAPRMRSQLRRQYAREVAEDLVAEAITRLAAMEDIEYEDARDVFGRIALNAATDYTRKTHDDVPLTDAVIAELGGTAPFPSVDDAILRADFNTALRQLPESEREAFILTELRGLSVREAASLTNVSPMTVSRRSESARIILRKELS